MNNVVFNIWLAVGALALFAVLWTSLDVFTIKQLAKISLLFNIVAFVALILHLRACLKDNHILYKSINKIAGDLPH